MTIRCTHGGVEHYHATVSESKACWGVVSAAVRPSAHPAPTAFSSSTPMASERQVKYLVDLGCDLPRMARFVSRHDASTLIDELLAEKRGAHPVTPPVEEPPTPPVVTPKPVESDFRHEMIKGILPGIPDGYYAVAKGDDSDHIDFIRLSRPKHGKYRGTLKIQSIHGAFGDGRLEIRGALWPSGSLSIYDKRYLDPLMTLIADHQGAALLYGRKIGRCARCNSRLTDETSRHYGVGPECIKHVQWIVDKVDAETLA